MIEEPAIGGAGARELSAESPGPVVAGRTATAGGALAKMAPWAAGWCRRQWSGLAVAAMILVPWILAARVAAQRAEQATQRVEARLRLLEAELQAERQGAGKLRDDVARLRK